MGADGGRGHDEQVAGTDEESGGDGGAAHGGYSGPLEGGFDDGVFGGSQQFVFGDQAQGAGISLHRISDRDALLCRWQVGGSIL